MLVEFWMVQRLTREINELEKQMMDKRIQMEHYVKYSSALGSVSNLGINNLAGLSSEILPRASLFAQYADNASSMSAAQNLQTMKLLGRIPFTGNPMVDMQIQTSAYAQFKQEALKALKEQETAVLNEKEKEIRLAMNAMELQLTKKKSELQAYKDACKEAAKNAAPDFG